MRCLRNSTQNSIRAAPQPQQLSSELHIKMYRCIHLIANNTVSMMRLKHWGLSYSLGLFRDQGFPPVQQVSNVCYQASACVYSPALCSSWVEIMSLAGSELGSALHAEVNGELTMRRSLLPLTQKLRTLGRVEDSHLDFVSILQTVHARVSRWWSEIFII